MNKYHKISVEKWQKYSLDQQFLMIGNEINRWKNQVIKNENTDYTLVIERILELIDITTHSLNTKSQFKEFLRLRYIIAYYYINQNKINLLHIKSILKVLLMFSPVTYQQIQYLL